LRTKGRRFPVVHVRAKNVCTVLRGNHWKTVNLPVNQFSGTPILKFWRNLGFDWPVRPSVPKRAWRAAPGATWVPTVKWAHDLTRFIPLQLLAYTLNHA
jgi:hypothetical protein